MEWLFLFEFSIDEMYNCAVSRFAGTNNKEGELAGYVDARNAIEVSAMFIWDCHVTWSTYGVC